MVFTQYQAYTVSGVEFCKNQLDFFPVLTVDAVALGVVFGNLGGGKFRGKGFPRLPFNKFSVARLVSNYVGCNSEKP